LTFIIRFGIFKTMFFNKILPESCGEIETQYLREY
jgi:hypothetical protein